MRYREHNRVKKMIENGEDDEDDPLSTKQNSVSTQLDDVWYEIMLHISRELLRLTTFNNNFASIYQQISQVKFHIIAFMIR